MGRPVIGICTALERARWSVWDQQALLLPRDVVVAALGMLVVLDTVEAVVPPAFADLVRQLVAVLGEHDVD